MTGPTTAAELLELAAVQVQKLLRAADREPPRPSELAAAWPAFLRAAQQLLAVTARHRPDSRVPAGGGAHPPIVESGWARPEPHLQRATALLGAAADLIASRDRYTLSATHLRADAAYAAPPLLAVAHLVAQATLPDPALLATAASASGAFSAWLPAVATEGQQQSRAASFDDASTLVSRPTPAPGDLPGLLDAAVHDWQRAARDAAEQAAPSSTDLEGAARAAGGLIALSQVLLTAHTAPGPDAADPVRQSVGRLRAAGAGWNTAAGHWRTLSTGTPPSRELLQATVAVDTTISLLARTAGQWTSAQDVRGRAGRDAALAAARGALAAVQAVAEVHTPLVARLAQTGAVYARARRLAPSVERLATSLDNKWILVGHAECAPLTEAYRRLPAATAAARLRYTSTSADPAVPASQALRALWPLPPAPPDLAGPDRSPPPATQPTIAGQRWRGTCDELDPRLADDPHYPALAAALDRIALVGVDVSATLACATAAGPLPDRHAARTLHYQLIEVCPAAVIPYTAVAAATAAPSWPHPDLAARSALATPAPGRPGPAR